MAGTDGITPKGVSEAFTERAKVPRHEMDDAHAFAEELAAAQKLGVTPQPERLAAGRAALEALEQSSELYSFNAAVLAGQTAESESDLASGVDAVVRNVEKADKIAERLRTTLSAIKP